MTGVLRLSLLRLALVVLTFFAASCASVKSRLQYPLAKSVDGALRSAHDNWQSLPAGADSTGFQRLQCRLALDAVLETLETHGPPRTWTGTQSIQGWTITFAGDPSGIQSIPPSWCDRITLISKWKNLPGIHGERASGDGIGLPVIMHQPRVEGSADKFVPLNGRFHPATLTADFTSDRAVTLTFHHTRNVRTATLHHRTRPLAWDLSAAISAAMDPMYFRRYSFRGLIRPDSQLAASSIYTPEPWDPRKIPVVLIHGIESAPHIWANVMNEISLDPALRGRFQVWYFLYPTGLSIPSAAERLRTTLTEARSLYDPRHRSPSADNIVLVGHSLGGLLSKMQIMDSGEDLYHSCWTCPVAELPFNEEARAMVDRTLHFQHLPFVTRAVFITTPHHGSTFVDLSIMRLAFKLVRPARAVGGILRQVASAARYVVNPELHRFETFGVRSNEGLSPRHPMLRAMNNRPLLAKYHSIIAVFRPMSWYRPPEKSTDGVVPWQSAWLPGAESTSVIHAFHSCVQSPSLSGKLIPLLRLHASLN